jgi:hypothetical protein
MSNQSKKEYLATVREGIKIVKQDRKLKQI